MNAEVTIPNLAVNIRTSMINNKKHLEIGLKF
jgi:hypothetical protein